MAMTRHERVTVHFGGAAEEVFVERISVEHPDGLLLGKLPRRAGARRVAISAEE